MLVLFLSFSLLFLHEYTLLWSVDACLVFGIIFTREWIPVKRSISGDTLVDELTACVQTNLVISSFLLLLSIFVHLGIHPDQ